MNGNTGLSREEIIRLLDRGFTRTEVAEFYDVSPQAVNWHLNVKHGGEPYKDPRQRAMEHIPWEVESRHKDAAPFHRLRDHVKLLALGEKRLSKHQLQRLRSWYDELEELDVVLEYDPEIPPSPNMKTGGWRYVPREDRDGDLLLRLNDYAKMTDEAYIYFRRPERRP